MINDPGSENHQRNSDGGVRFRLICLSVFALQMVKIRGGREPLSGALLKQPVLKGVTDDLGVGF